MGPIAEFKFRDYTSQFFIPAQLPFYREEGPRTQLSKWELHLDTEKVYMTLLLLTLANIFKE